MLLKSIALTVFLTLLACSTPASASLPADSIKGEWVGVFLIAGHTAEAVFTFDVDGSKVSGTVSSDHTGPGTVTGGKFEGNKLTCTFTFEKHESIVVTGVLKDGKLGGDFATEGMTGTWTAARKKA